MATTENEYYLRAILLLAEGGSYISKQVLNRENCGDLNKLLKSSERKLKNELQRKQIEKLFPQNGNTIVDTWDLQMLIIVVLRLFHNSLTREEIRKLRDLKSLRNEVQAHSSSVTLDAVQYDDINDQLTDALTSLASGFEDNVQQECKSFINKYTSGPLDVTSARDCLKQLQNNDVLFKQVLEKIDSSRNDICTHIDYKQKILSDDVKNVGQQVTELEKKVLEQLQKNYVGACRRKIKAEREKENQEAEKYHSHPSDENKKLLKLAMECSTVNDLVYLWKMFQEGGAAHYLDRIADALSKYSGERITLTSSLNLEEFKEALEDTALKEDDSADKEEPKLPPTTSSRQWFLVVQYIMTLVLIINCVTSFILILGRFMGKGLVYTEFSSQFITSMGMFTSGLVSAFCVTLFDEDRQWFPRSDQNYLSWSFGLVVVSGFLAIFAAMCLHFDSLRIMRDHKKKNMATEPYKQYKMNVLIFDII